MPPCLASAQLARWSLGAGYRSRRHIGSMAGCIRAMESGCWVLGGEFEDSVFEERRERLSRPPMPYGAKRCEPQWFYEETESSDDTEVLTLKKFRGDLAYRQQEYELAVCSSLQNLEKTIFCLQKLISLHPLNPWIWHKLAKAYLSLGPALPASCASSRQQKHFSLNDKAIKSSLGEDCLLSLPETLPESSVFSTGANSSHRGKVEKAENTQNCLSAGREAMWVEAQMTACAALIRTRLLLQLTQPQQTSFALEKNLRTQQEIADKMKGFSFTEDALLLIEEVMGEDIVPEKIKDELHSEVKCVGPAALTGLVIASSKEFEDKWFRKIKEHFCL
ncbi:uncharacterized protein C8orf76 homolog isoform X7 [Nannospalax galili]|uniref:uncharacterized protein C8orf76 homolog isoform X7 n=1 Tax=Nannospalax galili TaxID=1026970 RepID=UPI00111C8309|nr:uncharacterized protein C8orf76 homolog isoform X7 [Nannospalax galili]